MLTLKMLDHRFKTDGIAKTVLELHCDAEHLRTTPRYGNVDPLRSIICQILAELSQQPPEFSIVVMENGIFVGSIDSSGNFNNTEAPERWNRYNLTEYVEEIW